MPRILTLAVAAIATALTAAIVATGADAGAGATRHLVIRHVENGCHIWSDGSRQSVSLRLNLTSGARLHIVNRDIVAQQLVQLTGQKLSLRGHMMPGKSELITFSQPGVYQFKNKVIKMGPPTKTTTSGPDNRLRLTVSVR